MQHRSRFIYKTQEGRRLLTSGVYITKQSECVTMYSKWRVYYKTIQDRTGALRSTESGAYITERQKTKRKRYNLQKTARITETEQ